MGLTNFPNGISSQGVPVTPGRMTTGNIFYVDVATGSDGNKGTSKSKPLASLNAAIGKCTANKGDLIYLMPNHYEDIADTSSSGAIDLDVAGISVIGLGSGSNMPRFDFNHADSDFLIGANNVTVENVNFEATVTGVKLGVAIEAGVTGTTIRGCKFTVETTTTDEFLISINLLAGCNNTIIEGNYIDMGLGGAAHAIKLVGASSDVRIYDNTIKGDYSTANIGGITTLSTEVDIRRNLLINGGSGGIGTEPVIEMLTGTTGYVVENHFFCNVATIAAMTVADTMFFSLNYASEDVGAAAGAVLRTGAASVTASADD
jgi:hypothetical protein